MPPLRMRDHVRLNARFRIVAFCLLLFLPGPLGALGISGWKSFPENRELAQFPWSSLDPLDAKQAAQGLEAFFSDNFAFRPILIYAVARAKLMMHATSTPIVRLTESGGVFLQDLANYRDSALGQPQEAVLLGKQGWMFLNDLIDYRGLSITRPPAIATWKNDYIKRQRWVEQQGAHFLLVIAPQKGTVYPEYLPDYAHPLGNKTRRDEYLGSTSGSALRILDLTSSLIRAKQGHQLYYKYDTHWNFSGAYFGARAIINYLHSHYNDVPVFSDRQFTITQLTNQIQTYGDEGWYNLGVKIGVPFLKDDDFRVERRGGWTTQLRVTKRRAHMNVYTFTKDDPTLPSLVVYADSFGYPLKQIIAEYFRKAVFVNPYEDEKVRADEFPTEIIEEEKPDYFIYLRWEHAAFVPIDNPPALK